MSYLTSLEKRASFPLRPAEQEEETVVTETMPATTLAPALPDVAVKTSVDYLPREGRVPSYDLGVPEPPEESPFDIAFGGEDKLAELFAEVVDTTAKERYAAGQLVEKHNNLYEPADRGIISGSIVEAASMLGLVDPDDRASEMFALDAKREQIPRADINTYLLEPSREVKASFGEGEDEKTVSFEKSIVPGRVQQVLGASQIDPESKLAQELRAQGKSVKKISTAEDIRRDVINRRLKEGFIQASGSKEEGSKRYREYLNNLIRQNESLGFSLSVQDAENLVANAIMEKIASDALPEGADNPLITAQRRAVSLVSDFTEDRFSREFARSLPGSLLPRGTEKLGDPIDPNRILDPYVEEQTEMKLSDPLASAARGPMSGGEAERAQFLEQRLFFPVDFEYAKDKAIKTSTAAAQTLTDMTINGELLISASRDSFNDLYQRKVSPQEQFGSNIISDENEQNRYIVLAAKANIPVDKAYAISKAESTGNPASFAFNLHLGQYNDPKDADNPRNRTAEQEAELRKKIAEAGIPVDLTTKKAQNFYGEDARRVFDIAARIDPVSAVMGGAWGEFQVTGKYGDALGLVKEMNPAVESDTDAALQFIALFSQDPGGVGDEMFSRWFQKNPTAQKYAQEGDIAGLATEYYGKLLPVGSKDLTELSEVDREREEKRRQEQLNKRDRWISRATKGSNAYISGMADAARAAKQPTKTPGEEVFEPSPAFVTQQGTAEGDDLFTSETFSENQKKVEEQLELDAIEVPTGVSELVTMFSDTRLAPTPGSAAFIEAIAPINDAKENDVQLYDVVRKNSVAPMGEGFANVSKFIYERDVRAYLGERPLTELTKEEAQKIKKDSRQKAFKVVTSAQTEGLWLTSFYTSYDYLLGKDVDDTTFALAKAMAPRIEVMGRTKNGFVFRQEGNVLAAAAALDAPPILGQSYTIGVIGNYAFPEIEKAYTEYLQGKRGAASLAFAAGGTTAASVVGSVLGYVPLLNELEVEWINEVHRAGVKGVAERQNFVELGLETTAELFASATEELLETPGGREVLDYLIESGTLPVPYELTTAERRYVAAVDSARALGSLVGTLGGLVAAIGVPDATDMFAVATGAKAAAKAYRLIRAIELSAEAVESLSEGRLLDRATGLRPQMFEHGEASRTTLAQLATTLESLSAKDLEGASTSELASLLQLTDDIIETRRLQDDADALFRNDLTASVAVEVDQKAEKTLAFRSSVDSPSGQAARYASDSKLSRDAHTVIEEVIAQAKKSDDPVRAKLAQDLEQKLNDLALRETIALSPGQTDRVLRQSAERIGPEKVFNFSSRIEVLRDALLLINPATDGMAIRKAVFNRRMAGRLERLGSTDVDNISGFVNPSLNKGIETYGPVTEADLTATLAASRIAAPKKAEILKQRSLLEDWHQRFSAAVKDDSILDPQVRQSLLDEFESNGFAEANYRIFKGSDSAIGSRRYHDVVLGVDGVAGDAMNAAFGQSILTRALQGVLAAADARGAAYKEFAVALINKKAFDALKPGMSVEEFLAGGERALRMRRFRYALQSGTAAGVTQIILANPVLRRLLSAEKQKALRLKHLSSAAARMAVRQEMIFQRKTPLDMANLLRKEELVRLNALRKAAEARGDTETAEKFAMDITYVKSPMFLESFNVWLSSSINELNAAAREGRAANLQSFELPVGIDPAIVDRPSRNAVPLPATRRFFRDSYSPAFGFEAAAEVPVKTLSTKTRTKKIRLGATQLRSNEIILDQMLRYMAGVDPNDSRVVADSKVQNFLDERLKVRNIGSFDFESRHAELTSQLDEVSEDLAKARFGKTLKDFEDELARLTALRKTAAAKGDTTAVERLSKEIADKTQEYRQNRVSVRSDAFNLIIPLMSPYEAVLIFTKSKEELDELLRTANSIGPRTLEEALEVDNVILSRLFQDTDFLSRLKASGETAASRRVRRQKDVAQEVEEVADVEEVAPLPELKTAAEVADEPASAVRKTRRVVEFRRPTTASFVDKTVRDAPVVETAETLKAVKASERAEKSEDSLNAAVSIWDNKFESLLLAYDRARGARAGRPSSIAGAASIIDYERARSRVGGEVLAELRKGFEGHQAEDSSDFFAEFAKLLAADNPTSRKLHFAVKNDPNVVMVLSDVIEKNLAKVPLTLDEVDKVSRVLRKLGVNSDVLDPKDLLTVNGKTSEAQSKLVEEALEARAKAAEAKERKRAAAAAAAAKKAKLTGQEPRSEKLQEAVEEVVNNTGAEALKELLGSLKDTKHGQNIEVVLRAIDMIGPARLENISLIIEPVKGQTKARSTFDFTNEVIRIYDDALDSGELSAEVIRQLWQSLTRYVPFDEFKGLYKEWSNERRQFMKNNPGKFNRAMAPVGDFSPDEMRYLSFDTWVSYAMRDAVIAELAPQIKKNKVLQALIDLVTSLVEQFKLRGKKVSDMALNFLDSENVRYQKLQRKSDVVPEVVTREVRSKFLSEKAAWSTFFDSLDVKKTKKSKKARRAQDLKKKLQKVKNQGVSAFKSISFDETGKRARVYLFTTKAVVDGDLTDVAVVIQGTPKGVRKGSDYEVLVYASEPDKLSETTNVLKTQYEKGDIDEAKLNAVLSRRVDFDEGVVANIEGADNVRAAVHQKMYKSGLTSVAAKKAKKTSVEDVSEVEVLDELLTGAADNSVSGIIASFDNIRVYGEGAPDTAVSARLLSSDAELLLKEAAKDDMNRVLNAGIVNRLNELGVSVIKPTGEIFSDTELLALYRKVFDDTRTTSDTPFRSILTSITAEPVEDAAKLAEAADVSVFAERVTAADVLDEVVTAAQRLNSVDKPIAMEELFKGIKSKALRNELRFVLERAAKRGRLDQSVAEDGRLMISRREGQEILSDNDVYVESLRAIDAATEKPRAKKAATVPEVDEALLKEQRRIMASNRRELVDYLLRSPVTLRVREEAESTGIIADIASQVQEILKQTPEAATLRFDAVKTPDVGLTTLGETRPGIEAAAFALNSLEDLRKHPPKSPPRKSNYAKDAEGEAAFATAKQEQLERSQHAMVTLLFSSFEGLRPYIDLPYEELPKLLVNKDFTKIKVRDTKKLIELYRKEIVEALQKQGVLDEVKRTQALMRKGEFEDALERARQQPEAVEDVVVVERAEADAAVEDVSKVVPDETPAPKQPSVEPKVRTLPENDKPHEIPTVEEAVEEATQVLKNEQGMPVPLPPLSKEEIDKADVVVEAYTDLGKADPEKLSAHANARNVDTAEHQSVESLAEAVAKADVDATRTQKVKAAKKPSKPAKTAKEAKATVRETLPDPEKVQAAEKGIEDLADALKPENAKKVAARAKRLQKLIDESENVTFLSRDEIVDYVFDDLDEGARKTLAASGAIDDIVNDLVKIFNRNVSDIKYEIRRLRRVTARLQTLAADLEGDAKQRALRAAARSERQASMMEVALSDLFQSNRLDEFAELLESERKAGLKRRRAAEEAAKPPEPPKIPRDRGLGKVPKDVRGMVYFVDDSQAIIYAFRNADASTGIHEMAHVLRRNLREADLQVSLNWVNSQLRANNLKEVRLAYNADSRVGNFIGRADSVHYAEEIFADAFEQYLREGVAPTNLMRKVFQIMKDVLHKIFISLKREPTKIEISPEMYEVFDSVFGAKKSLELSDVLEATRFLGVQEDFPTTVKAIGGRLESDLILEDTVTDRFRQLELKVQDYRKRFKQSGEASIIGKLAALGADDEAAPGGLQIGSRTKRYLDPISSRVLSVEDRVLLERFRRGEISRDELPSKLLPALEQTLRVLGETAVLGAAISLSGARLLYGDDSHRALRAMSASQRVHMTGYAREAEEFHNGLSVLVNDVSRRVAASADRALDDLIAFLSGNAPQLLTGASRGRRLTATNVDTFEHFSRMMHDLLWRMDDGARQALINAAEQRLGPKSRLSTRDDILPLTNLWKGFAVRSKDNLTQPADQISGILLNNDYIDIVGPEIVRGEAIKLDGLMQDTLGLIYQAATGQSIKSASHVDESAVDLAALLVLHSGATFIKNDANKAIHIDEVLRASGLSRGELFVKGATVEIEGVQVTVEGLFSLKNLAAEQRMPVLMAVGSAGYTSGALDDAAKVGFGITGREYRAFLRYTSGQQASMTLDEISIAESVVKRFGISAQFGINERRLGNYYMPKAARDALEEQSRQGARLLGFGDTPDQNLGYFVLGVYNSLLYSAMVFGSIVAKPVYRLASLLDLGLGATSIAGNIRSGAAALTRASLGSALALAYEGVPLLSIERAADIVGRGAEAATTVTRKAARRAGVDVPGDDTVILALKQRLRDASADAGDKLAQAITEASSNAKYRPEVRPIMEGRDDMVFLIAGRPYRASDLRRTFVRTGLYNNMFKSIKAQHMAEGGSISELLNKYRKDSKNVKMAESFLAEARSRRNNLNLMGGVRGAGDAVLRHGLESADAWADLERTGLAVTFMEMGYAPQTAARMVVEAVYDYRGSMTAKDRSVFNRFMRPFFAFTKNAMHHATNLMSSPQGRFYARSMAKLPYLATEAATSVLYEFLVGPYGINTSAMNESELNLYYDMRGFLEYGLGDVVDRVTLREYRQILPEEDQDISDEDLMDYSFGGWTIRQGYNGYDKVPENVRVAMRALISSRSKLYAKGRYVYVANLLQEEEVLDQFVRFGKAQAVQDEPSRRGQAAFMAERYPTIQVPYPVLDANSREAIRLGMNDSLLWMLPDNFVHSGIQEASAMLATLFVVSDEILTQVFTDEPFEFDAAAVRALNAAEPLTDIRGYGSPLGKELFALSRGVIPSEDVPLYIELDPFIARMLQGSMIPVLNADDVDQDDLSVLGQMGQSNPDLVNAVVKIIGQAGAAGIGREVTFPFEETRAIRYVVKDGQREAVFVDREDGASRAFVESSASPTRKKPFLVGKSALFFKITPLGQLNQAFLQYRVTAQEDHLRAQTELRSQIIRFVTAQGRQAGLRTAGFDEDRTLKSIDRKAKRLYKKYE